MPKDRGGLAISQPWSYFLAAQLQQVGGREVGNDTRRYSSQALMSCTPHISLVEALEANSLGEESQCPSVKLMLNILNTAWLIFQYSRFKEYAPI